MNDNHAHDEQSMLDELMLYNDLMKIRYTTTVKRDALLEQLKRPNVKNWRDDKKQKYMKRLSTANKTIDRVDEMMYEIEIRAGK
jgi:hypothetical protein